MQFTFGSDPEFCLQSPDGQLLSAIDRVADTDLSLRGATIFPDNVLVELNIPPGKSAGEFQGYLRQTLTDAARMVAPNRLVAQAAAVYPDSEMQHRKAHVFGCDPEFDAWKMEYGVPTEVDRPKPADNLRTCGGHIHIGIATQIDQLATLARAMDLYVGIPSILLDHDPSSQLRQRLYGGPGRFRATPWGLEYRTLSNYWLASPDLVGIVNRLTAVALEHQHASVPADIPHILEARDQQYAKLIYERMIKRHLSYSAERLARRLFDTPSGDLYEQWSIAL